MKSEHRFVDIGHGNRVNLARILVVTGVDSSPIKRMILDARDRGTLIDATSGNKSRSVIVTDSDHVILSALETEELMAAVSELG